MTAVQRVQQWLTFNRAWWLFDAKWQDPYISAKSISKYLLGIHKPIYSKNHLSDYGDCVVVINSAQIALKADEWYYRVYFHHTGYPGGASWTKAWEVHKKDPTMIVNRAVYGELGKTLKRRPAMARLLVFKDANIPKMIAENITDQIRPHKVVPRRLDSYKPEEIANFPKLYDYPKDFVLPVLKPRPPPPWEKKEKE